MVGRSEDRQFSGECGRRWLVVFVAGRVCVAFGVGACRSSLGSCGGCGVSWGGMYLLPDKHDPINGNRNFLGGNLLQSVKFHCRGVLPARCHQRRPSHDTLSTSFTPTNHVILDLACLVSFLLGLHASIQIPRKGLKYWRVAGETVSFLPQ
eukprot:scaffold13594_cov198-Alexandrium_tamarense.AAC.13